MSCEGPKLHHSGFLQNYFYSSRMSTCNTCPVGLQQINTMKKFQENFNELKLEILWYFEEIWNKLDEIWLRKSDISEKIWKKKEIMKILKKF